MFANVINQNQADSYREQDSVLDARLAIPGRNGSTGSSADEAGLVQAARAGDLSAFNSLVTAHQDSLYWWVFSLVKDEALADDIAQAAFITAYEKLNSFRGGSLRAWLFTIARNRCYDELRRKKRYPALSLDASTDDELDMFSIIPAAGPRPEEIVEAGEQAAMIERMLARLPEAFQQVLRLVDMEALDYQEAADILGLPLGTLKSRLTRARLKLRQIVLQSS